MLIWRDGEFAQGFLLCLKKTQTFGAFCFLGSRHGDVNDAAIQPVAHKWKNINRNQHRGGWRWADVNAAFTEIWTFLLLRHGNMSQCFLTFNCSDIPQKSICFPGLCLLFCSFKSQADIADDGLSHSSCFLKVYSNSEERAFCFQGDCTVIRISEEVPASG